MGMAKKKFTREQERAYWQGKHDAYVAMSRRMLEDTFSEPDDAVPSVCDMR